MKALKLIQSRDEIKTNSAKVGKAVYDILSKPQSEQTVEETIDSITPKYFEELLSCVNSNIKNFDSPFYVVVLRKKEFWATNVLRQWYVARQTKPSAKSLRSDYPNHDHDVYQIDSKSCSINLLWVLPTKQDANTIIKNKHLYDDQTVGFIEAFNEGRLA